MTPDLTEKLVEAYLLIDGVVTEQESRMTVDTDMDELAETAQVVYLLEGAMSKVKLVING